MNIEMPGPSEFRDELAEAVAQKTLTEAELDASLRPLLTFYDKTVANSNKGKKVDLKAHHQLARRVAEEAIVLLENDGILPLPNQSNIGVVGSFAHKPRTNGGGSATLKPYICEEPETTPVGKSSII